MKTRRTDAILRSPVDPVGGVDRYFFFPVLELQFGAEPITAHKVKHEPRAQRSPEPGWQNSWAGHFLPPGFWRRGPCFQCPAQLVLGQRGAGKVSNTTCVRTNE